MFLIIFARAATLVLLLPFAAMFVTSMYLESESFNLTDLGQVHPIHNDTLPPVYPTSGDGQHSDQSQDGHTPSQLVALPRQECPTHPPVDCIDSDCDGSYYPPDPYKCKNESTTIINSVEVTLFGCLCCHHPHFWCNDEECDGGSDLRCHSDVQMGCPCFDPAEEPIISPVSLMFYPDSPELGPQRRSSNTHNANWTLEEPRDIVGEHKEKLELRGQIVHAEKPI